jgi:hypothetical protein
MNVPVDAVDCGFGSSGNERLAIAGRPRCIFDSCRLNRNDAALMQNRIENIGGY